MVSSSSKSLSHFSGGKRLLSFYIFNTSLQLSNRILIVLLTFFMAIPSLFGTPDSLYYSANDKYQEEKYEEAIELYHKVITYGYESASLYYNLGNAYFRSNKIGKARLYYEKALKLDSHHKNAKANLAFIENLLVDKFDEIPVFFLKKWIKSLIRLMNSHNWGLIFMITFLLAFFSFSLYLLLRHIRIRKTAFFSGMIFILVSILSFLFSWQQRNYEVVPGTAIVIDDLVNVKSSPRGTGTDLFVLHEGAKVWLDDLAADWREIRLSDGRKGWLPSSAIEEI